MFYILAAGALSATAAAYYLGHDYGRTAVLAAAVLLFVTAVYRESRCAEEHQAAAEQADHDPAATQVQAWLDAVTELDAACCDHWWTSCGTDHAPTCRHHTRRKR